MFKGNLFNIYELAITLRGIHQTKLNEKKKIYSGLQYWAIPPDLAISASKVQNTISHIAIIIDPFLAWIIVPLFFFVSFDVITIVGLYNSENLNLSDSQSHQKELFFRKT